eukprot:gene20322-27079_t
MNGGTNISLALQRAGQLLKSRATPECQKSIVLITDGRAKETRQMAATLSDEHPNVTLFAFGVGRGVDRSELFSFLAAAPPCSPNVDKGNASSSSKRRSDDATSGGSSYSRCNASPSYGSSRCTQISPHNSMTVDSCPSEFDIDMEVTAMGKKRGSVGSQGATSEVSSAASRLGNARMHMKQVDMSAPTERYMDLYVREDAPW